MLTALDASPEALDDDEQSFVAGVREQGWFRTGVSGDDFPCLQIVWPDRAGRFPWEPDFDAAFKAYQPDLTEQGWVNDVMD